MVRKLKRPLPLDRRQIFPPMRILLSSYTFAPAIGGIESMSLSLAQEWTRLGHEVTVLTQTPDASSTKLSFDFQVVRRPKLRQLRRLILRADVFCQNNISLHSLWPWPCSGTPLVIAHQTWLYSDTRVQAIQTAIKRGFIARATNISISVAIRDANAPGSVIIGNAYDSQLFRVIPGIERNRELIFVGRLVKDKGADVLLQALAYLREDGLKPRLTLVGSGEEDANLRAQCAELKLESQVEFTGSKRGDELVSLMCAHQIQVVPSTWNEPFGIVALEGIACGCAVVGSEGGGLADAIGPCGRTFPNGDARALAQILKSLLQSREEMEALRSCAPAHLERFTAPFVARAYLEVFERAMKS